MEPNLVPETVTSGGVPPLPYECGTYFWNRFGSGNGDLDFWCPDPVVVRRKHPEHGARSELFEVCRMCFERREGLFLSGL